MQFKQLGLIGYGEVGRIFCAGLMHNFELTHAWDLKFTGASARAAALAHAAAAGVKASESMTQLCERPDLIISAVTAANNRRALHRMARGRGLRKHRTRCNALALIAPYNPPASDAVGCNKRQRL